MTYSNMGLSVWLLLATQLSGGTAPSAAVSWIGGVLGVPNVQESGAAVKGQQGLWHARIFHSSCCSSSGGQMHDQPVWLDGGHLLAGVCLLMEFVWWQQMVCCRQFC